MKWLFERFESIESKTFINSDTGIKTYGELLLCIQDFKKLLLTDNIEKHSIVAIVGDYCFETIALFLALANHRCIVVPITSTTDTEIDYRILEGKVKYIYSLMNGSFELKVSNKQDGSENDLISKFIKNEVLHNNAYLFS